MPWTRRETYDNRHPVVDGDPPPRGPALHSRVAVVDSRMPTGEDNSNDCADAATAASFIIAARSPVEKRVVASSSE